jgi:hypothetical protein
MQLATRLSVIGHTLQIRREKPTGHPSAPTPHLVLAAAWRIRQLPHPTEDAPALAVTAPPGQPYFTSVLAIGEVAQGLAYAWGMRGHAGGQGTWTTRTFQPGPLLGMATGTHGKAIVHTLSTRGSVHAARHWEAARLWGQKEPRRRFPLGRRTTWRTACWSGSHAGSSP